MLKIKIICLYVVISVFVCVNSLLNLPEGAPCSTSGHNGICVNLFKCHFTAIGYLYNRAGYNTPPLPDTCSYREDEEPIVCCAECSLDPGETMRYYDVMPGGYFYKNTGSVAWKKCLEYFRSLPYSCRGSTSNFLHKYGSEPDKCEQWSFGSHPAGPGGIPARRWQFPHKALLGYGDDQNSAQWLCGGSVISEHYILTAAHCLGTPNLGKVKFAALGVLKRSDLEEYWKVYRIVEAIPYPEYKSPVRYHDIALLRTETEINFGRGVLPACLETGDRGPNTEDIGEAPGWGRLGHRQDLADTLQVLTLHKYEDHECAATFPPHRHLKEGYNRTTQMCYGRKDALVDTCEGDSGGPLHDDLEECMYFIFGITSFGKECGVPGTPGMYTRVRFYVPWIESIVWPDEPEIKRSTTL